MTGLGLQVVRGRVEVGGQAVTAQVAVSGLSWAETPVTARKFAVRRVKTLLCSQGAMCAVCAEVFDPDPPACALCSPARLLLWDGREEYPVTNDMLKVYVPSTRFSLVAAIPEDVSPNGSALRATTAYAALELRGEEWTGRAPAGRHQLMRDVVDRFLGLYPGADLGAVRTLVWDGKREIPYPVNWPDVLGDQAG